MKRRLNLLLVLALVVGVGLLIGRGSSYFSQIAITTMIFVILTASLNYVTGTAGLLTLGHAAFFGVGAYTAALLSTKLGWPFWLTLPAAGVMAAAIGAVVAIPTMRLTSIYFAVATLGIELDEHLNDSPARGARVISAAKSPTTVLVIPTNEELAIARATLTAL